MFNTITKSIEWGGKTLTLETGKIARQADGCVIATLGETCVMSAVTFDKKQNSELDFFPLTVNYQEKYYSSGKIPGGFFKREAKPSEASTLISRLIDRPIRPLFPDGFKNPVDIVCSVLSHDMENDPDILAMIASSAALAISGAPFQGPIGAARVGFANDKYILNPSISELDHLGKWQKLDLVVAGTSQAVMMVESLAYELTEEQMLEAVVFGHNEMQPIISLIDELKNEVGKSEFEFVQPETDELSKRVSSIGRELITDAYGISQKTKRIEAISSAKVKITTELADQYPEDEVLNQVKELESSIIRNNILEKGQRIDDRELNQVRPIECEVGLYSRPHGSALFTRGETQALVMTTLGTGEDEQIVDALHGNFRENFLLHYNFPPYSVGETGRMGPPGRREIGHGKLAWRALKPVLPQPEHFPYTIRVVSEITESNGSSSMATVCGASLSMLDAAVPLKEQVAGVAMGLILGDDGNFAVLTDILGGEDHFGDMDFKVAGTKNGVTSLQMDIKVAGITPEIMSQALDQARDARMHILNEMSKTLSKVGEFSKFAPRIISMKIPVDKIREVIGAGGKVIREITELSGAKIEITDDGVVRIASPDNDALEKASGMINEIVAVPEIGKIYTGKVVKIMDFGAFVNFIGKKDGLVHVSQITNRRLGHPSEVLQEGQEVKVKLIKIDDRGKFQLSMNKAN